jgi:dihydrolipoamide dehydrogenase
MSDYQVIVIGAGPAGYVAAIRAAQLGARAAVIEAAEPGGVCLNWGCIPTKTLLHSADVFRAARAGDALGVVVDGALRFDLAAAVRRSRAVAQQLNRGVRGLLRRNGVELIHGHARLAGEGRVRITDGDDERTLSADGIVIATGARPRVLPGLEPDGERIWTAREAMTPDALPGRLAVIGAGAIGVEFASFYAAIGSEVTLVEMAERILPGEDAEISERLASALREQGIRVLAGHQVNRCQAQADGVELTLTGPSGETQAPVDRVIVAAGITGNVEELGAEGTGVVVDRGHIVTDAWSATGEPGVYAIGDVAGPPWLAHKASQEGIACIERLLGAPGAAAVDPASVPGCTYSHPQVASVGLTEAEARAQGHAVRVGRFPLAGNGKALARGESDGLVKTVFDEHTGALLGAHLIGPEVTELISTFVVDRQLETTEAELMHSVFPHPTLSESLHESVLNAWDRGLHA